MNSKILDIIAKQGESTPKELCELAGVSRQYLHRQLNQLAADGQVRKIGSSPLTYYQLAEGIDESPKIELFDSLRKTISDNFLQITVHGELLYGMEAFVYWCKKNDHPLQETAMDYEIIIKRHERYMSAHRCIDSTESIKKTMGYGQIHLNQLMFLDYTHLEKYGRTKLGYLLHFAKISQNRKLTLELISLIKPKIHKLLQGLQIDAIAFVPPTEKREVQIMRMMEAELSFNLPIVKLVKVNGEIAVPQKALSALSDRIENARSSIIPIDKRQFETLLIIDDKVASGATLNETARKLKQRGIAKRVLGLGVVGSMSGF